MGSKIPVKFTYRLFDMFNVNKYDVLLYDEFILGMSILQNKCKILSIEIVIYDLLSNEGDLTYTDMLFVFDKDVDPIFKALIQYYIEKWDKDLKGYVTRNEFITGFTSMNAINKAYILQYFTCKFRYNIIEDYSYKN
jgi:hypothetical protein